jgi:hypothetical protein
MIGSRIGSLTGRSFSVYFGLIICKSGNQEKRKKCETRYGSGFRGVNQLHAFPWRKHSSGPDGTRQATIIY